MITPKSVCDSGLAMSMAQARRLIALDGIREICGKCGACRCDECQTSDVVCRLCGSREIVLNRKGK